MNRDIIGNSVIGLALGFALSCIGFSSTTELHKMLLFSDQRLLYTFFLAVLLLAGSWKLIAKLAKTKPDWAPKPIHRGTIAGGLLFGIGWALCGACPSVVFIQLGEGQAMALCTLVGIGLGNWMYAILHERVLRFDTGSCQSD